jgi:hypothetical protein
VNKNLNAIVLTAIKLERSGGQEQGTLMGRPLDPVTAPSQSPVPIHESRVASVYEIRHEMNRDVPVGFTPDEKPNWGTRASFTSLRVTGMDNTVVARIERKTKLDANFIADAADRLWAKTRDSGD